VVGHRRRQPLQDFIEAVSSATAYSGNAIAYNELTALSGDMWYPYPSAEGYKATTNSQFIGEILEEGIIASIPVSLNMCVSSY
jgi:hypothetical protein